MPIHLARWTGLAGSTMLAAAAFVGGALPSSPHKVTPIDVWQGRYGPLLLVLWVAGLGLFCTAWWAVRDRVPSPRWALVTVGLWLLPLLVAPPLGSRDGYAYACQGATYAGGFSPYEQGVSVLPCPWLETVSPIWRDTAAPYGPLFVLLAAAVVILTDSLVDALALFRLLAVAGLGLLAACLPVLARRCGVPPGRALWLALGSPLVGVHLVSGMHNDALMVGLLVAGLAIVAARPGRPGPLLAGGVLLGLAGGIKATALVVVPFAALAAIAGVYSVRGLLRAGGWVVGGAVSTVVGVSLVAGLNFGWIAGLKQGGLSVAWTSPPTAVGQTLGYLVLPFGWHIDAVPVTRAIGLAVLLLVLIVLWWRARTRNPLWYAGLALAATVALAPVFHPWYWTWPLAVLAATSRRFDWAAAVALLASFLVLPDGTSLPAFSKTVGAPLMTLFVIVVTVRWAQSAVAARRRVVTEASRASR
ncbi:polyprenol phosphomannose-dependent alpha 1,6 mannosyltransferase MptB [Salinispora arenicola]|uniref:polyprenol phosphomannose-dependent alpha 1,6 mannosyltransferase MptB n=1 Tax=Salinispora arenicola TaxID=168697 RepID=UPI00039A47D6|nr:polyprenol phosphomannose-dependent alpha 1,6 mannosyltransferase MptB [Salinispora arenicola]